MSNDFLGMPIIVQAVVDEEQEPRRRSIKSTQYNTIKQQRCTDLGRCQMWRGKPLQRVYVAAWQGQQRLWICA